MEPRGDRMSELGVIPAYGELPGYDHHGLEFRTGLSASHLLSATKMTVRQV